MLVIDCDGSSSAAGDSGDIWFVRSSDSGLDTRLSNAAGGTGDGCVELHAELFCESVGVTSVDGTDGIGDNVLGSIDLLVVKVVVVVVGGGGGSTVIFGEYDLTVVVGGV